MISSESVLAFQAFLILLGFDGGSEQKCIQCYILKKQNWISNFWHNHHTQMISRVATALEISAHSDQENTPEAALCLCFVGIEGAAQYGSYKNQYWWHLYWLK